MSASIVDATGRDITAIGSKSAVLALLLLTAAAASAAWLLSRRPRARCGFGPWFAALASTALVVSVTLLRDGLPRTFAPNGMPDWSTDNWSALSGDFLASSQIVLNMILFVPFGVAWALWSKRWWMVAVAALGVSAVIESLQGLLGAGATDVVDVIANLVGSLVGIGLAVGVRRVASGATGEARSRRVRGLTAAGAITAVALLIGGWFLGASHRQGLLEEQLRRRFANTERAEIDAMLEGDSESVWTVGSVRSDGSRELADGRLEIRYPAPFFGLHRCVFVTWSSSDVAFRGGSGDECTRFRGGSPIGN